MNLRYVLPWLTLLLSASAVPALAVSVQPGWPQSLVGGIYGSPALGDLDGDGDLEVVASCIDSAEPGDLEGHIYAWHGDGTLVAGWPQGIGGTIRSSPVLGDLDRDGDLEVLVGSEDFNVYAWHGNGTPVAGWPQITGGSIWSCPALGDLDGDGDLEVVVGSFGLEAEGDGVYAWHGDGTPVIGWPQSPDGGVLDSPALGDLDGDGDLEVVVGSDGLNVSAWHGDGTPVTGWPQGMGGLATWVYSSPALGDLDGDGDLEVVVGSMDHKTYAWHGDGSPLAGWPQSTEGDLISSPALGDLDGDEDLEVVVGSQDHNVYAWHGDGSPVAGWPQSTGYLVNSSPALGDLDGDGDLEVVVGSWDDNVYAWHGDGSPVAGWPQTAGGGVYESAALGDVDGDGDLEVVVCCDDGDVYAWSCDTPTSDLLAWPVFQHDARHTGVHGPTSRFWDVPDGFWAWREIGACVEADIVQGYAGGWYHPEVTVSRDQMAVFIARGMAGGDEDVPTGPAEATFDDVPTDHWAYKYVEYCVANDIVQGFGPVTYGPAGIVARDSMAVFVSRAVAGGDGNVPEGPAEATFDDVPTDYWAYKYVEYCVADDIVQGYGPATYGPTVRVARDQMAVFICRAFRLPV